MNKSEKDLSDSFTGLKFSSKKESSSSREGGLFKMEPIAIFLLKTLNPEGILNCLERNTKFSSFKVG